MKRRNSQQVVERKNFPGKGNAKACDGWDFNCRIFLTREFPPTDPLQSLVLCSVSAAEARAKASYSNVGGLHNAGVSGWAFHELHWIGRLGISELIDEAAAMRCVKDKWRLDLRVYMSGAISFRRRWLRGRVYRCGSFGSAQACFFGHVWFS